MRPKFPDTVLDRSSLGDINEMEEVGNNMTWPQATLPFIYTPDSASFQPGEFCVHLGNRSWLWGLT